LSAVGPYGVDACSGLEISPGIKDHSKLREFVRLVKTASP
jgi:phosphoribosylanthranilate isomerase